MKTEITSELSESGYSRTARVLQSPFPYYLNDDRKNLIMITSISFFVIGFMILYRPYKSFEEEITVPGLSMYIGVIFSVLVLSIVVLPKIFPKTFDPVNWTVQKYLVQTFFQMLAIGAFCSILSKLFLCADKPIVDIVIHAYTQVALIGIITVSLVTLILRNSMLHENLREALQANQQLEKIRSLKNDVANADPSTITLFSDTSETLTFNLRELLFIQADDNYSTIFWMTEGTVQKKILRINLKNIEAQLNNSFTLRCHRSFIVNIHAISNVTGNTNGYKLRMKDTNHFVPVARPKGKEVMEKITELKNMMELY